MKSFYYLFFAIIIFESCGVSKSSYSPTKKYSGEQLTKDYDIFQSALEQSHAGLYWYTSKERMDAYFKWGRNQLKDSATESVYRNILSYVTAQINCGHTSVRPSKAASRFTDTIRPRVFPLSLKLWKNSTPGANDTAVITTNFIQKRFGFEKRNNDYCSRWSPHAAID